MLNIKGVNKEKTQQPEGAQVFSQEMEIEAEAEEMINSSQIVALLATQKDPAQTQLTEELSREALLAQASAFVDESSKKGSNPSKSCPDCVVPSHLLKKTQFYSLILTL